MTENAENAPDQAATGGNVGVGGSSNSMNGNGVHGGDNAAAAAAATPAQTNHANEGGREEEEEDNAELERMMAFQEEQQAGDHDAAGDSQTNGGGAALGARPAGIENDPNVAFLGDDDSAAEGGDDADADADGNGEDGPPGGVHPNLNNPAAIALRQRQALQNAARLNPAAARAAAYQHHPYVIRKLFLFLRPSLRYTPLSLLAAGLLLHHTLRTRQQFYLALVYLQSSKLAYILLGNAIIAMAVSTFSLLTKLFLDGGLRPNERDSIGEHIRWDVTETCLALTIFRSELDVTTAIEFLGLVILKCLHWSVELRGGHLRMTEEVFIYPDEEDEDDDHDENEVENLLPRQRVQKRWYQRIPHLRMTHIRYYALVQILLLIDIFAVAHCALSVATHGPSVDILFGFESAILLVSGLSAMGSYHLHVIDGVMGVFHHLAEGEHHHVPVGGMATDDAAGADGEATTQNDLAENAGDADAAAADDDPQQQGEEGDTTADAAPNQRRRVTRTKTFAKTLVERLANPWRDRRATLSFAIELQAQAAKFLFYVVFFAIVFTYYGMPINIFREVYVSFQQLRRRLIAFNTYRRLTHNMDKRFESIKDEEELDRLGRTCIICRDQMDLLGGCKKLPGCGHAFHTHCLREWLVQQQTCPTCRADIAANEARIKKQRERERAAAAVLAAAEQEAAESAARDAGSQAGGDAAPAGGTTANADEAREQQLEQQPQQPQEAQAQARNEPDETNRTQPPRQQPASTPALGNTLPPGWSEHLDPASGKSYYFNIQNGQSSWDKPVAGSADESQSTEERIVATTNNNVATNSANTTTSSYSQTAMTTTPLPNPSSQAGFPCLYRVTSLGGAPIFLPSSPNFITNNAAEATPQISTRRFIGCGKLIVCTGIEYWPMPFQEAMLCMPDGYVRSRDVERFLMLANNSNLNNGGVGEESKRRAVGVAR